MSAGDVSVRFRRLLQTAQLVQQRGKNILVCSRDQLGALVTDSGLKKRLLKCADQERIGQVIVSPGQISFDVAQLPTMLRRAGVWLTGPVVGDWGNHVETELRSRINKKRPFERSSSFADDDSLSLFAEGGDSQPSTPVSVSESQSSLLSPPDVPMPIEHPITIRWASESVGGCGTPGQPQPMPSPSPSASGLALVLNRTPPLGPKEFKQVKDLAEQCFNEQKQFFQNLELKDLEKHLYLQLACVQRMSADLLQVRKVNKTRAQRIRRLEERLAKAMANNQLAQTSECMSLEITRKGRRLTWHTSVILGLRKLMCIVSASSFPLSSLTDVSRWTVTRCEVLSWAVLLGRVRAWHNTVKTLLGAVTFHLKSFSFSEKQVTNDLVASSDVQDGETTQQTPPPLPSQDDAVRMDHGLPTDIEWVSMLNIRTNDGIQWSGLVGSTFFSSDATNSSIWQRRKLQGLEVRSMVLTSRRALQLEDYNNAFKTMKCMSDLQVTDGSSAVNMSIALKQFAFMGVSSWQDLSNAFQSGELHESYFHMFVNVGDTGPDQAAFRGSMRTLFAKRSDFKNMLFLGVGCLKHQYHLVVGGQLKLADLILQTYKTKVKYCSTLATMSHTWRAHLSKMRSKWSELHQGTRTEQNRNIVFKTPPLAVAGRWASIDGCEQFYMEAGLGNIAQLFVAVFEGVVKTGNGALTDESTHLAGVEAIDGLAVDESRQYKEKISKYIRNSLAGVKESIFFVVLLGGNKCREPLLHHYNFLCKKLTDTTMHVVEFVVLHIAVIQGEFSELLATFLDWGHEILAQVGDIGTCKSLASDDDGDCADKPFMTLAMLAILLYNAAAFDRRVVRVFSRWPWPLFRLLRCPLDRAIADRSSVADMLLKAADNTLENTTLTIKRRCRDDLMFISRTGRMSPGSQIHAILAMLAINTRLDAGSLESLNSMIKSSMSLANNTQMSLELLSSRVNARKSITLLTQGATRVKDVRPVMESLAKSMPLYQGSEDHVLTDVFRWTPPQPTTDMVRNDPSLYEPGLTLSAKQKWALKFHRKLMPLLKAGKKREDVGTPCFFQCVSFQPETEDSTARFFLVAELTGRSCHLLELGISSDPDESLVYLELSSAERHALQFVTSFEAIAEYHDSLQATRQSKVTVSLVDLTLLQNQPGMERLSFESKHDSFMFSMYYRKPRETKSRRDAILDKGDDNDGNDSDDDDDDDDDMGDRLQRDIQEQEALLRGDVELSSDDEDEALLTDDLEADLIDLEELNAAFVAAATNFQEEVGISRNECEPTHVSDYVDTRPFEDEIGEGLLEEFRNQHDGHANSGGDVGAASSSSGISRPVFQRPQVTLSTSTKNVALSSWHHAVSESAECLVNLHEDKSFRMYDKDSLDASLTMQCSLILCEKGSCVVTWLRPYHDLKGRFISLDDDHKIIYPSHFVAPTSFERSLMVLPSIGSRVRKKDRELVQPWVRRLRDFHNVAADGGQLSGLGLSTFAHSEQCFACSFQPQPSSGDDLDMELRQCGFCLKSFHKNCCDQLVSNMESFAQTTTIQTLAELGVERADIPICLALGMNHDNERLASIYNGSVWEDSAIADSRLAVCGAFFSETELKTLLTASPRMPPSVLCACCAWYLSYGWESD
eukprot:s292_g16.t1